ncbi:GapS1 family protein [Glaciimonas sp. GNP009]
MKKFDEEKYFNGYKEIRNNLRKLDPSSVVIECLKYLQHPTVNEMKQLEKHPWLVLLLIKWSLIDSQSQETGRNPATSSDIQKLLKKIYGLAKFTRYPSDFEHLTLFMRAISFQQFFYQRDFNYSDLIRQFFLFADLPDDHFFKKTFCDLTGVRIEVFLELLVCMTVQFVDSNSNAISANYFTKLQTKYSAVEIVSFLKSFTKSFDKIKTILQSLGNGLRTAEEYYEQTPFLAFPLILVRDNYVCVERHVLFRCIEHFVYDKLRLWDAQKFMNEFGLIFERYVEMVIKNTELPYINETQIKQVTKTTGKLVDFIISDGEHNIFVDAKAVEMAYQAKVAHLSDAARERTAFILKAIEQAQDIASRLHISNVDHPLLTTKQKNFLVVVTYKALNLSNGEAYYEGVAKAAIDEIYAKYTVAPVIPLENIYFFSIDEFELLSEAVCAKKIGFAEALENAKAADSDVHTKKFDFSLHLSSWKFEKARPTYMTNRLLEELQKIEILLKA